jgi:hypothetical protein
MLIPFCCGSCCEDGRLAVPLARLRDMEAARDRGVGFNVGVSSSSTSWLLCCLVFEAVDLALPLRSGSLCVADWVIMGAALADDDGVRGMLCWSCCAALTEDIEVFLRGIKSLSTSSGWSQLASAPSELVLRSCAGSSHSELVTCMLLVFNRLNDDRDPVTVIGACGLILLIVPCVLMSTMMGTVDPLRLVPRLVAGSFARGSRISVLLLEVDDNGGLRLENMSSSSSCSRTRG